MKAYNTSNGTDISDYLYNVRFDPLLSGNFTCASDNLTITAKANIGAEDGPTYYAQCTVEGDSNGPNVTCSGIFRE